MRSVTYFTVAFLACTTSCSRDDSNFNWDRPHFTFERLPIKDSATCHFKQSFLAVMDKVGPDGHQQIKYSSGKENEADTLAFADLDTATPKIVGNAGQGSLRVLYRHDKAIGLVLPVSDYSGIDIFTIFTDSGVVLHSTQHCLFGPKGVMEMGFCS